MAFENKVILEAVLQIICKADSLEEAYNGVALLAAVEGKTYPAYEAYKASLVKPQNHKPNNPKN